MSSQATDQERVFNVNSDTAIVGSELHIHVNSQKSADDSNHVPTSIDTVREVTERFLESRAYRDANQEQKTKTVSVLQLQGMPGSGKSAIVRKLAFDFPFGTKGPVAKWHIECSDASHDVKPMLKKFLESMVKNHLVSVDDGVLETAVDALQDNRCLQYVNILASCKFPILIIVEDPKKEDQELLNSFLYHIDSTDQQRQTKIHVYITSQSKDTCSGQRDLRSFVLLEISGLEVDEALKFLGLQGSSSADEVEAAKRIIERLNGSPLGLKAVKATEHASCMEYLDHVENESLNQTVFEHEAELMRGAIPKQPHLYEAILFLLRPRDEHDKELTMRWRALCSLCFLHHGKIPMVLVERVMHYLRNEHTEIDKCAYLNSAEAKEFVKNLHSHTMCEMADGNQGAVSFHEVVFIAMRMGQFGEEESALRIAIKALASVVHKDIRKPEVLRFMRDMCPHMAAVLKRKAFNADDHLLPFCRAHMHEVVGISLESQQMQQNEVSRAEQNLMEALSIWLGDRIEHEILTNPGIDENADEVAKSIVETLIEEGRQVFSDPSDLESYISIVLHPKSNETEYYKKLAGEEIATLFDKTTNKRVPVPAERLAQWRRSKRPLFLDEEMMHSTYLSERIASVLHTMSRLLIYHKGEITEQLRKRSIWFSTLCLAICRQVQSRFGIAPIFLRINAIASVSIRLRGLKQFPIEQRRAILLETKRFVEKKLQPSGKGDALFYEHGISMHVDTEAYDALTHKRSVVRINAKLVSLGTGNDENDYFHKTADERCGDLYEHTKRNMEWGLAPKCIVYCGKYWCARKNYAKALGQFEEALECQTVKSDLARLFPWVCYNHARAVVSGRVLDRAEASKARCEEALGHRENIEKDLVEKLEICVSQLNSLLEHP